MNINGIKNKIEALARKAGNPEDRITEIHRIIVAPGPREHGEPPNPIPTGEVIIRMVGQ